MIKKTFEQLEIKNLDKEIIIKITEDNVMIKINDDIMFNEIMEHKQVRWDIRKEYRCEKCEPIWI